MSFADWTSFDEQKVWKSMPEFPERIGRVRGHCTEFTPSVWELVTQIDS